MKFRTYIGDLGFTSFPHFLSNQMDLNKTSRSKKEKLPKKKQKRKKKEKKKKRKRKKEHIPSYDEKGSQVTKRSPNIKHRSRIEVYDLIFFLSFPHKTKNPKKVMKPTLKQETRRNKKTHLVGDMRFYERIEPT